MRRVKPSLFDFPQSKDSVLILSRRPGESLTIGNDIVVTVVGVSGNQIRLGITAPREVRVLREEVYKAMRQENQAAANLLDSNGRLGDTVRQLRERKQRKSRD
jgi:carbon storage regulator